MKITKNINGVDNSEIDVLSSSFTRTTENNPNEMNKENTIQLTHDHEEEANELNFNDDEILNRQIDLTRDQKGFIYLNH